MSLSTDLTAQRLRELAGAAFMRGRAYCNDGNVRAIRINDESVTGVVVGGMPYQVRVSSDDGELSSECTCPVGHMYCKHAVALGLAYLEQHEPPETPSVALVGDGFATRPELEAWAREHHVLHALTYSAEPLCDELPTVLVQRSGLRYVLGRLVLRDVSSLDVAVRYVSDKRLTGAIVDAAARALRREADAVSDGIAEEKARETAVLGPALMQVWSRLLAEREPIRVHAFPRGRAARSRDVWNFDAKAATLSWKERGVTTSLAIDGEGNATLSCSCLARHARCTHSLALIDATLDVLEDPSQFALARRIADVMMQPGWERALEEFALLDANMDKPQPAIEVWWHIEHELGMLTLTPAVKKKSKRGAMSTGARMSASRLLTEHRDVLSEMDLQIAEQVASWSPVSRAAGSYAVRAFAALVGHPRVVVDERRDEPIAVRRVPLTFTAHSVGDHIRIEPSLDGARIPPKQLAALFTRFAANEPLVVIDEEPARCWLIDVSPQARQLWNVLDKHGDGFPRESHERLLGQLARLEHKLPLVVPPALKGLQLPADATTVMRLRLLPNVTLEIELFIRPGGGAPIFPPGSGPRDVMLVRDGARAYVRRDLGSEGARARAVLDGLPLDGAEEGPPFCFQIADNNVALELVAVLQTPRPGFEVEWLDEKPVVLTAVGPAALKVSVEKKRDWFGIIGELKIEHGRLELAVLLDAARRQQRFVRVDANRWQELSDTLRQRRLAISDQTFTARSHLELSPGAVPAIRALADDGANVSAAPAWEELTARLASSKTLNPSPPKTLKATLRDYQIEGYRWLTRVAAWGAGACLADDMGLGKTLQSIAVLLDRAGRGPALVLAPTSVALNWVSELARFAPRLQPVMYAEQGDRADCLKKLKKNDVLIVSYGLLVRDADALGATTFATLVIDEAQALKNPNTQRAKAARSLDAGFRIALSGTPFENHLGELWSLFSTVFPGLLGSLEQFRERYAIPIEGSGDPNARAALARVLRPFLLRRTKAEVASELPSRTEIQVPVALSTEESQLYDDARMAAVAELSRQGKGIRNEQQRFAVLAALTRLRLLASHPRLYDPRSTVASSKMRRLLELLDELRREGHRVLVFSQFTSHLALVREELDKAGFATTYLDGSTPAKTRATLIDAFQNGHGDVFLISLKAGGTGINLTAADNVIHLDPWWNPAVEDQATDRAHRIGQTKPVTVYRLITHGTIEEKILAMHVDKRSLVASVLDGTNAAAKVTTQDLLALLTNDA